MEIIIHQIAAVLTLLFGLYAIVQPQKIVRLVSLTPYKNRGITEIRATYGGLVVGAALATLWLQTPDAFLFLAFIWWGAAITRFISFYVDKSYSPLHLRILLIEVVVGTMLLL